MWKGNIWVKSNAGWSQQDWEEIKKWSEVQNVWSTTGGGTWDWWIELKPSQNHIDNAAKVVWNLRKYKWVADTRTWWSKEWSKEWAKEWS
ncbi:hypothetical protein ACNVED_16135 (plasmid) [Legionella sp. D16C41]|uniref:hypothetical protein n=1 Tax=Legionella sp. D16C41 TaxID=3402688 RepID=UPI003AF8E852